MQRGFPSGRHLAGTSKWLTRITHVIALVAISAGLVACDNAMQSVANNKNGAPTAQLQLKPDTPSVLSGGQLQFSATVINVSNSAVVWSTSAGSITSSGLFLAPTVAKTQPVKVTARTTSANAEASVIVNVTVPVTQLTIATTSLPPGRVGTSYSETVAGSGGTQPYQWRIISGALPPGLNLDSLSGVVSGVSGRRGIFPFVLGVTDAAGKTATQTLTLTIEAAITGKCGPPTYPCSRTDLQIITAKAPPQLGLNPRYYGGHAGAGLVGIDPAYSNRILRVTDGNIDSTRIGQSYFSDSSAEKNVSSFDETLFFVHNEDGRICLFEYDAAAFSAKYHGCYYNFGKGPDYGYTPADAHAFYSYSYTKLYRFLIDTSTWTITADPTFNGGLGYFDPDGPECLNGQMAANNWSVGDSALASDDNTHIAAIGPSQDNMPYYVVWNATKGCQWLNVQTWQVSKGWNTGLANPVDIAFASGNKPLPGGIHNAQIDRSGAYGVLTVNKVPSLGYKLFWTIGTNKVDDTCVKCTSHWACDFGVCFWDMSPGTGFGLVSQRIGSLSPVENINATALAGQWGDDEHMSHANATQGERLIYLASWQPSQGDSTVSQIYGDEITGVNWDGSMRTIRFNKDWASGYGGFSGSARCSISRQGNYALCGTDYQMYNLDKGFGNGLNQDTCDHNLTAGRRGTNGCRSDVLLFELR